MVNDDIRPREGAQNVRWSAHEHRHFERGRDWYIALGIIAVATAITAILFGDVLFSILIVCAAVTLGIVASTPPRLVEFEITAKGLRTGETFHSYKEILSFWVSHDEDMPLLLVDTTKLMSPNLIIALEGVSADRVRESLLPHAKEKEMHEPTAHKILALFGF